MAEDSSKIPVSTDESAPSGLRPRGPLENLRQGIDRLFDDFGIGTWRPSFRGSFFDVDPLRRAKAAFSGMPAVDVTETEKGYKVVAELPGMDEKNIEVKIANGRLMTRERSKRRRRKRGRITMFASAVLVHSSALSLCPMALSSTRLTPVSRKAS